jgi:predicted transposase YbfD/YdcC
MRAAEQTTAGHGRLEKRRLWMLPIYDDFLAWPGARLMLRLERTVIRKATGEMSFDRQYALASLDADQISPAHLLALWRQHWQIENCLHYVRDVTLGEDASRVRKRHAPQTFAAIRNLIIATLRRAGFANIAQAIRTFAQKPYSALAQFILL